MLVHFSFNLLCGIICSHRLSAGTNEGMRLSYVLNSSDDGSSVSVVTDSGSHGTHVAGIAAGFVPE